MTADSDLDLLARMRSGDREAYAVLVARHIGLVQTACRRQAAPGDEDDCVQAVFLILERKPAAAGRAPVLAAWLLRVAWYVCRNSRRIAQRRRQAERDAAAAAAATGSRPEALDHLDDCLQRLPGRQRDAVTLHYLSGKPAEEVAAVLGTSRDNAYQLISRGLAGLRQLLARRGVAIAGAGLASVLAAEAQAATITAQPALLASLSGAPSTSVTTLSNGALHAMTIATLTPFAAVAGFALAIGSTALLLAAEPVAPPEPAPATPATAPATPAAQAPATAPAANPMLGGWNTVDTKVSAENLSQKILADPWLAAFTKAQQRAPKAVFGKMVVRANDEVISTAPIRDAVERQLMAAGSIVILDEAAAAGGKSDADVVISGSLTLAVDAEGGTTIRTYSVAMQGVAVATGQKLFSVETRIRKEIEKTRWK